MSLAGLLFGNHQQQLERFQRGRVRVSTTSDDDRHHASASTIEQHEAEEGSFVNSSATTQQQQQRQLSSELVDTSTSASATTTRHGNQGQSTPIVTTVSDDDDDDDEEEAGAVATTTTTTATTSGGETDGLHRFAIATQRATMTLGELEEERELARRRSSACVLFALFVLFRLWIMALQEGDFGLLLLCLIGTSWTARWIRHNREQEEELDRRIASYIENTNDNGNNNNNGISRHDLRLLSFQAQLALAIMESQRQMMEGGYGHPDGDHNRTPGVSDEAKSKWDTFTFKPEKHMNMVTKGQYGSVKNLDDDDELQKPSSSAAAVVVDEEEPHCSICLGEYEENEKLVRLPLCGHIYHDECINSWCTNHTRCPLCNLDLSVPSNAENNV